MRKAGLAVAALVAFGVACDSAFAAGGSVMNDAAGQAPNMDQMTPGTHDPMTRTQVEHGAIEDAPAAGQANGVATPAMLHPATTFEQTQHRVDQATVQDHAFPDASGNVPAPMQD